MPKQRLARGDLEEFIESLESYLLWQRGAPRGSEAWDCKAMSMELWKILVEELPRYVSGKWRMQMRLFAAESGEDWSVALSSRRHLLSEGAVIERSSLLMLVRYNQSDDWDPWLFNGSGDLLTVFLCWIEYLRRER